MPETNPLQDFNRKDIRGDVVVIDKLVVPVYTAVPSKYERGQVFIVGANLHYVDASGTLRTVTGT